MYKAENVIPHPRAAEKKLVDDANRILKAAGCDQLISVGERNVVPLPLSTDELALIGLQALLLEAAAMRVWEDPAKALQMLPGEILDGRLGYLRTSVLAFCHLELKNRKIGEAAIQAHFYRNLSRYLPGAAKSDMVPNFDHRPDGFVHRDGETMPVEVKLHEFDGKALDQLLRYMRTYDCKGGIAVAPKLTCELPDGVTFVQIIPEDVSH